MTADLCARAPEFVRHATFADLNEHNQTQEEGG